MNNLVLNTHLSLDDYIKVNLYLLYQRFMVKVTTAIGIFILAWLVYYRDMMHGFPWLQSFLGLYLIVGFPLTTYFSAKRNYRLNSRIREHISYEFNEEYLEMIGDTFRVQLTWSKIYRVSESNSWVLIWQNPHTADIVPKRDFTKGTLAAFKNILTLHPSVKNDMKKRLHS
ncbi:MAG TPA: YcxB family protein [Cytophagaceae bacterium]|jgi:hypothetical protein|nr:YcxB family protein [Cytophagaceae bacterium]